MKIEIPEAISLRPKPILRKKAYITLYARSGRISLTFNLVDAMRLEVGDKVILGRDTDTKTWYFFKSEQGFPIQLRERNKGYTKFFEFVNAPFANGIREKLKANRSFTLRFEVDLTPVFFNDTAFFQLKIVEINDAKIE